MRGDGEAQIFFGNKYCIVVLTRDCLADRTDCRSVRVADRIGKLSPIPATQGYLLLSVRYSQYSIPLGYPLRSSYQFGRPSVALTERRTTAARACDFISTFASSSVTIKHQGACIRSPHNSAIYLPLLCIHDTRYFVYTIHATRDSLTIQHVDL